MRRVVVVGAGPAGSAAAMTLAGTRRLEVLLVDRATFPRRKACGSALSPWALDLLDELGAGDLVRREAHVIRAALIGAGRLPVVELRGGEEAVVLLRARLDTLLAHEAARRGAELVEGVLVREFVRDGGRVVGVRTSEGDLEADAVIDASGANTRLSRTPARPGRTLHAIMGWYEGMPCAPDTVELYFDPVVRPWYGWVFPESPERVNVGICYAPGADGPTARERFAEFVEARLAGRMARAEQLGDLVGHPIATTGRPTALSQDGLLVAGEAGRLVDAATAEGIHHALASGLTAGALLADLAARGAEPTSVELAPFTKLVRRRVGLRLRAGTFLVGTLRTPALDLALRLGSRRPVQRLLTRVLSAA
jgi:geranylgeranyl reductase family protein